jgi:hypothetical protein
MPNFIQSSYDPKTAVQIYDGESGIFRPLSAEDFVGSSSKTSGLLDNEKGLTTSNVLDVSAYNNHSFQIVIPGTSGQVKIETSPNGSFWSQISGDFAVAGTTGSMFVNSALFQVRARNVELADSGVHAIYFGTN